MYFDQGDEKPVQAAHNLNLSIHEKEMIAVIGESGCGKSTIGKMALGVLKPTRGQVLYDGVDVHQGKLSREKRRAVQVVHQDSWASLNPVRTVLQTLSAPLLYSGKFRNNAAITDEVKRLLCTVGLEPADFFMYKYPFQLSGGQRQRVSIARATIFQPRLIVADEPVSAVDASLRLTILDLMRSLSDKFNIAFLYITHDLATARYFAPQGKLIVMYLGRMVETGIIEECIASPAHPYLQALLKAIPSPDPKKFLNFSDLPLKSLEMPSPKDPPPGCVFHPRCPYATDICSTTEPVLRPCKESMSGSTSDKVKGGATGNTSDNTTGGATGNTPGNLSNHAIGGPHLVACHNFAKIFEKP
jgi:peptide/nickel transport system ATP-binding protein